MTYPKRTSLAQLGTNPSKCVDVWDTLCCLIYTCAVHLIQWYDRITYSDIKSKLHSFLCTEMLHKHCSKHRKCTLPCNACRFRSRVRFAASNYNYIAVAKCLSGTEDELAFLH